MKSNNLQAVDHPQGALPLQRPLEAIETIDINLIRKQPSLRKAVGLCISHAGFECDKTVYMHLEIDAGHWSRIMNGSAHFPLDKLEALMDLCGNEIPLMWLTDRRGYVLKRRLSALEAELLKLKEENSSLRTKNEHYQEFISIGSKR